MAQWLRQGREVRQRRNSELYDQGFGRQGAQAVEQAGHLPEPALQGAERGDVVEPVGQHQQLRVQRADTRKPGEQVRGARAVGAPCTPADAGFEHCRQGSREPRRQGLLALRHADAGHDRVADRQQPERGPRAGAGLARAGGFGQARRAPPHPQALGQRQRRHQPRDGAVQHVMPGQRPGWDGALAMAGL